MSTNSKEALLAAAKRTAQAHGYTGLNFRDLAEEVGIKAASMYYHFPSKADLGAAVARRYWEDTGGRSRRHAGGRLEPVRCLRHYPDTFSVGRLRMIIGFACAASCLPNMTTCRNR